MENVIVVGGGIIGLSSAYYLQQAGYNVTVLDRSDFLDNCSYGNCGYVCPSHFIPLAAPGIVRQGFEMDAEFTKPFLCAAPAQQVADRLGVEIYEERHERACGKVCYSPS
jgi:glycine/D-amino acid oxidase-like deaminating enzyme